MKSLQHSTICLLALVLGAATVGAGQTTEIPGSLLADRAYHELTLKNYQAAIDNFHEALAANPLNSEWRKDLGYAYISAGLIVDARREFTTVYRANPGQPAIALELGFLSEQLHDGAVAEDYYKEAAASPDENVSNPAKAALASMQASQLWTRKQQAFDLLAGNRRSEAAKLFEEIHSIDPADGATALQLGYIYLDSGDNRKARQLFSAERGNQDADIARRAASGLDDVNRRSALWFGDIYTASLYQSRFSNEINELNIKSGIRLSTFFQPYVGMRISRDTRSKKGLLPTVYSDNALVLAFGIQAPLRPLGATLYAEAGTAFDLLGPAVLKHGEADYRGGVNWSGQWGVSLAQAARTNSKFSVTGSGYSDVSYYQRYDHNVIGYVQLRQGVNLPTARVVPMQILLAVNVVKDSKNQFYNNIIETAPVIRIAPFRSLPEIQLEAQYVRGYYPLKDQSNPYSSRYRDVRFVLTWGRTFRR